MPTTSSSTQNSSSTYSGLPKVEDIERFFKDRGTYNGSYYSNCPCGGFGVCPCQR